MAAIFGHITMPYLNKDHPRNIPGKFDYNWPCGFRKDSNYNKFKKEI